MSEAYDDLRRALIARGYSRAYEPWALEEDLQLKNMFHAGASALEISERHSRTPGAIRARLVKIGLIAASGEDAKTAPEFRVERFAEASCEPPPASVSRAFNEHWDLISKLVALGMEHLEVILPNVSERDREVMVELLGTKDGRRKTLQEVADQFGISKQRVSQIRKRVRQKLLNRIL